MAPSGERPLNALIVGCGSIAGGFDVGRAGLPPLSHAGALTRDGRFHIVACIDPDADRRRSFMTDWGVPRGFDDIGQVDPGQDLDLVSICSPTPLHAAHIEAALRLRPRLIFCEKPLALDLGEAENCVRQCDSAGVLLAVNYTRRWAPDVIRLREELASGRWGDVRSAVGYYNKGVMNNGGHMIDLLHFLLESPIELIAVGPPSRDFGEDDPSVPALLIDEKGIAIHLGVGNAADYSLFELHLTTVKGVLTMEGGGFSWRIRERVDSPYFEGYRTLDEGALRRGEYDNAMTNAVANIHAALAAGTPLASTGDSALAAQSLCDRIRRAAEARPA